MKSSTTPKFWQSFNSLPERIQELARKQYRVWQENPRHPSLQFKPVGGELWSARITQDYRALALSENNTYYWIWIGTHAAYDQLLRGK